MSIRTYWICKLTTVLKFGSESSVQLFQRLKIRIYRRHSEFLSNWSKPDAIPFAVAAYIISAYWFTASTSFANPAVTVARSLSDRLPEFGRRTCRSFLLRKSQEP